MKSHCHATVSTLSRRHESTYVREERVNVTSHRPGLAFHGFVTLPTAGHNHNLCHISYFVSYALRCCLHKPIEIASVRFQYLLLVGCSTCFPNCRWIAWQVQVGRAGMCWFADCISVGKDCLRMHKTIHSLEAQAMHSCSVMLKSFDFRKGSHK